MICTSCSADRHSWNLCMSWRLIKRYHDVDIDVLFVTLDKTDYSTTSMARTPLETWKYDRFGWLVGWFGFNGPLRQYFNLYRAVSQREGVRKEKWQTREKCPNNLTRICCKCSRPLPYCNQNCRTPRHWKFTAPSHHPTTPKIWSRQA